MLYPYVATSTECRIVTSAVLCLNIGRLGVDHDGKTPSCPNWRYIMSTAVPGGKKAAKWSPCSKETIQALLR